MKTHTQEYKEQLISLGKEIDGKITYTLNNEQVEIAGIDLVSVTPHYEGALLKSVMKQLDFVTTYEIPINTIVNFQFGLKVGNSYEYIHFNNYIVNEVEKQEDTNTYLYKCYDKMLYAMKDYEEPKSRNLCGLNDKGFIVNQSGVVITNSGYWYCIIDTTNINSLYVSGDYTLLSDDVIRVGGFNEYPILGSQGTRITPRTNTAINTTNYNYVMFCFGAKSGHTIDEIKSSFQIEIGTSGTPYTPFGTPTYPITIRKYLEYLCDDIGLSFANISDTFTNYDQTMLTDPFKDLGYTKRDVLDQLAEVTASTICINDDDELEVRYINETKSTNLLSGTNEGKSHWTLANGNGSGTISSKYFDDVPTFNNQNGLIWNKTTTSTNWHYLGFTDNVCRDFIFNSAEGTKFTLSYDIRVDVTTTNRIEHSFMQGNAQNRLINFGNYTDGFVANEWTHIELTGERNDTTTLGSQVLYLNTKLLQSEVNSIEIVNVKIELGDKATPYSDYDLIDEEYIKNTRAEFSEKYGPVNSIVLSRSGESDNVYLSDDESIAQNGLTEIKIVDNQIMNDNTRDRFLPGLLARLDGLEYYPCDYESIGITYLELCDKYNVKARGNYYPCVMLSDEIEVSSGLNEIIYADPIKQGVTDYTKADKTDRRINQTNLIVDKQGQTIDAIIGTDSENFSSLTELKLDIDGIDSKVESNYNFVREQLDSGYITPDESMQTDGIIELKLTGNVNSNNYLRLLISNNEQAYVDIPIKTLLTQGDLKDEVSIEKVFNDELQDYEYHVFLNRKLDYIDGSIVEAHSYTNFLLAENSQKLRTEASDDILLEDYYEGKQDLGTIDLKIDPGSHTFQIENYTLDYYIKYAILNEVVGGFATKAHIVSEINQTSEEISINANKISLEGVTTINKGFSVDLEGNMTCNNATANNLDIKGGHISLESEIEDEAIYIGTVGEETSVLLSGQFIEAYGVKQVGEGVLIYPTFQLWNKYDEFVDKYSGEIILRDWNENATIDLAGDSGNITCVSLTQTSQEKSKKNFVPLSNALDIIKDVDIYKYNLKNENDDDKKHIGFVIGDKFNYRKEITSKENNGVDIYSMCSVLWQGVKEQQKQIEKLQKEIDILKGGK